MVGDIRIEESRTTLPTNSNIHDTLELYKNIIVFIIVFNIYNYSSETLHHSPPTSFFQECNAPLNRTCKPPLSNFHYYSVHITRPIKNYFKLKDYLNINYIKLRKTHCQEIQKNIKTLNFEL